MQHTRQATVQCKVCKRIEDNGEFRLPWPGELGLSIREVYCPRCARETLKIIQSGAFARHARIRSERMRREKIV